MTVPDENSISSQALVKGLHGKSIVIVGMMGCGKTAIGRITANTLNLPFFDADEEVEKAAGMSVADIFTAYGEDQFRAGEKKVIARLLGDQQSVLALGGGAYLSGDTRDLIAQYGVSVWLKADLDVLFARVSKRPGKRPLLQTKDPHATLAKLLEHREPFYAKADIVVNTSTTSKNITRDSLIQGVETYLKNEKTSDA